jgi:hypothetical protein
MIKAAERTVKWRELWERSRTEVRTRRRLSEGLGGLVADPTKLHASRLAGYNAAS